LQYQHNTETNPLDGFRINEDTITVNPVWATGEQVIIDVSEPIYWGALSLEGGESTLLTGLSGYWKLDETSGTTVTDAIGTQNGTRTAGVGVGTTGILGYANTFNSYDDIITLPYNTNISPKGDAFSISIWFKIDSLPSETGRDMHLFRQGNTASPYISHSISIDRDDYSPYNRIYATSRNSSGTDYSVLSSGAVSIDTWYNLVFVNSGDGHTLQLYLNGSDVSASADTFTGTVFEGLSTTNFGNAYPGAPNSFTVGTIDSFGIWSRALTSGEVTQLYNSGNGRTYPFN